jgi:E3 ubiquitin-protein ligase TRIP12
MFNYEEKKILISGINEKWTEKLLVDSTICDNGYNSSSKTIKYLFTVLSELDSKEQSLFLQFVTGCPNLPIGGLNALKPKLTIVRKNVEREEDPNKILPSVMTCTNFLKLPEYSSMEILKIQLLKAIYEGQNSFLLS